ncbi:hypothetical protein JZ751_027479 [Albula glossodonta]|uniref:G-protein coupled receptors family 1 profile domain-containing protein n=1 Tax=Albula glossodonta TaxID=121402 RepID=A0A8T2NJP9_9TELE|nr:hypothetical protein JZ751_027479 [Albula glossodonta]
MGDSDKHTMECYYNHSVEFFYNASGKMISHVWRTQDCVVVGLGLTVCVIIILTNILVIASIAINRCFHYPIYYLLGNLAAADLFAGISYMYLMFHTGPWTIRLTQQQWFIRQGLVETSLTASVLNLLAMAVERHQTIFTMQLHSNMTNRRVGLLIVGIWAVSFVMGLGPMMGWHCLCNLGKCSKMAPMFSRSYLVFWAVLNLLSFSVMVAMYTRIFVYVQRNSQRMAQHITCTQHRDTAINLVKTLSIILGAFVICWTPGLVVLLLDGLDCDAHYVLSFEKYCLVLAECNSLVNPINYFFQDKDMRSTFKWILCCHFRKHSDHQREPLHLKVISLRREMYLKLKEHLSSWRRRRVALPSQSRVETPAAVSQAVDGSPA